MEDRTDICMMHVDIHITCKTGTVVCDVQQGQTRQFSDVVYGMGDRQQTHNKLTRSKQNTGTTRQNLGICGVYMCVYSVTFSK